ncbi:arginine N-succinyltransferase [Gallaecimonas xiamenensis]|uniref:Arginine N-succinyltransferase n=1 Tax=Gallaecimonas xiamenensis 3-C-1 TaxID=745411 RepID=K2J2A7_9GAMM|nr:arginine N-succinyltransferase [Gallaecimonas xiamenensis]EKE77111.1 arginine N-succinyltransferase [Gallaecimonas xiamenensis 3-C-1]
MLVIRPITSRDLGALLRIAEESGVGFTSLPVNEERLAAKIAYSEASFALGDDDCQSGEQGYLLVMEDTETGEVVGTTALEARVGQSDAFWHYHLGSAVHSSPTLGVHKEHQLLTLCNDYSGVSELCTLFLSESHRQGHNGRLLSKCRFLFLAEFRDRFAEVVIAEMRGVSDTEGQSPFWSWLQKHFFDMEFPQADYLSGLGKKTFIAELMPRHPVYVDMLPKAAQAVIGQVHDKTRPALKLLTAEGFRWRGYVDIFDAGPTVECDIDHIQAIRESERLQVAIGNTDDGIKTMIANTNLQHFRCTLANALHRKGDLVLDRATADALGVKAGDWVRAIAFEKE